MSPAEVTAAGPWSQLQMLEPPDRPESATRAVLVRAYGLDIAAVTFLPIGYDARSAVYAVTERSGQRWFLKRRQGAINAASLSVPRYLHDQGIEAAVAPTPALDGTLYQTADDDALILYPYIDGVLVAGIERTPAQHAAFGALLARIHATELPPALHAQIGRETYRPAWAQTVRAVDTRLQKGDIGAPVACALATAWAQRRDEIAQILARAEALGTTLRTQELPLALCHADIHTHNQILDAQGRLHIVDWDGVILAPKERDLMFVVGDNGVQDAGEASFFRGYGSSGWDVTALAYYRYEWVVQELGDCGQRVLSSAHGERTKRAAVEDFLALFAPGDVVESAYRADGGRG